MITRLTFQKGSSQENSPLSLDTAPITIFVGPNNSGKSQVLRELEDWSVGKASLPGKILSEVLFFALTKEEVIAESPALQLGHIQDGAQGAALLQSLGGNQYSIDYPAVFEAAENPTKTGRTDYAKLREYLLLRLDGVNRLSIINNALLESLSITPKSILAKIFWDKTLHSQIREILYSAFKKYFVIDATSITAFEARFSDQIPAPEIEEKILSQEAAHFYSSAVSIQDFSDGVKAFTGIVAALLAGNPKIVLLDEPEAFLHPGLAMRLGKIIGNFVNHPKKRLFISTHSASFIMGCIQSNAPVSIIRLTYNDSIGTTRVLERGRLLHLMRNPMLRSTGIIEALFHEFVIVTEADADRAFYQEINERLIAAGDPRSINNCLFVNAQNKQTVWDIVKPLRELGIPAVGIVDLDMVKDGGKEFIKILNNNFVPPGMHAALSAHRVSVLTALEATVPAITSSGDAKKDIDAKRNYWKRNGGLELLQNGDKDTALSFFRQLEEYGVFVVPSGELEDWLKNLGVAKGNKKEWLPTMFERMGEDPTQSDYTKPTSGDVWDFIGRIRAWMNSSSRLGIPS